MNNKKTSVSAPADGTGDGETRVEMERRIKEAYYTGNTKKAIKIVKRAYETFRKNSDNPGMAFCLFKLGEYYSLEGKITEAVKNYTEALELYKELDEAETLADIYNTLGQLEPDTVKAMEFFDNQLSVLQKIDAGRYAISWSYECKARKYEDEGDFRNALRSYSTILDIFENDNSPVIWRTYCTDPVEDGVVENEAHMAYIWQRMALIHTKMSEYDTAISLFNQVLVVCAKNCEFLRSECSTSDINQNMGDLEMERKDYRKALEYYTLALGYEPDKVDSESDYEIKECINKARQMMNWTERYSKSGGE